MFDASVAGGVATLVYFGSDARLEKLAMQLGCSLWTVQKLRPICRAVLRSGRAR